MKSEAILLSLEWQRKPLRGSFGENIFLRALSSGILAAAAILMSLFGKSKVFHILLLVISILAGSFFMFMGLLGPGLVQAVANGEGASPVSVDVAVTLILREDADSATVTAAVRESLERFFKNVSFRADYVSYAHVGKAILDTAGVSDYRLLTLDGSSADVSLADGEIPVLGGFEVTVDA